MKKIVLVAGTIAVCAVAFMSGNESFSLTQKERQQLRKYLTEGGFLLASPGCSDEKWGKAFRQEIKLCFPEYALQSIPMTHLIFRQFTHCHATLRYHPSNAR